MKDDVKLIPADAICAICGSGLERDDNANCENGHDAWVEQRDDIDWTQQACNNLGCTLQEILDAITNQQSIIPKKQ